MGQNWGGTARVQGKRVLMDTLRHQEGAVRGVAGTLQESGSMGHRERGEFPKGSINSSEAEQENNQKVPMRFGNKDATGNLSGVPSGGTQADWGALGREEEARGKEMIKKHRDQKPASPRAPQEALMPEVFQLSGQYHV